MNQECITENNVVEMIRSRGLAGRANYGKTMDRNDLAPDAWIQHLQEELADALQYAERIKGMTDLLKEANFIMEQILDRHVCMTMIHAWKEKLKQQYDYEN